MEKTLIAICAAGLLSACGGGGGSDSKPTELVIVGNSITYASANPSNGWYGNWGMAASAQEKDFAHLTAATVNLPLRIVRAGTFESVPDSPIPVANATGDSIVVIELGENGLATRYDDLIASVKLARKLVCVSSWSVLPAIDAPMKSSCESAGGTWVNVNDIRDDPANPDYRTGPQFESFAVNVHPHDWGMARIADRVIAAINAAK